MPSVPVKIMPQSHSSMNLFDTCPRQYEARYLTREVRFTQGPEAQWGDSVHKALETSILNGYALPSNMQKYRRWVDAVRLRAGTKLLEEQYAIKQDGSPCGYVDPNAWFRAKIDVVIIRGNVAEVIDWKTGKKKTDITQLRRYALLVLANHAEVTEVRTGYVWLQTEELTPPTVYYRMHLPNLLRIETDAYARIEHAYETGEFTPKPSGLCRGWCPVTSCQFWKHKMPAFLSGT